MVRAVLLTVLAVALVIVGCIEGQWIDPTWNYAVQVSVSSTTESPPSITLSWPIDVNYKPTGYTIYRYRDQPLHNHLSIYLFIDLSIQ